MGKPQLGPDGAFFPQPGWRFAFRVVACFPPFVRKWSKPPQKGIHRYEGVDHFSTKGPFRSPNFCRICPLSLAATRPPPLFAFFCSPPLKSQRCPSNQTHALRAGSPAPRHAWRARNFSPNEGRGRWSQAAEKKQLLLQVPTFSMVFLLENRVFQGKYHLF